MIGLGDTVLLPRTCPWCGVTSEVSVPANGLRRWQAGELVQQAFPEAPPEWREQLVSGLHVDCQRILEVDR